MTTTGPEDDGSQALGLGDPLAASPQPHPPRAIVFSQLDRFLIGKGPIQIREVPWPLGREDILEYVRVRLEDGALSALAASRVPLLAEAYLLDELPGLVAPYLVPQDDSPEALWRASSLCASVGVSGTPDERRAVADPLREVIRHEANAELLMELIPAREAVGPAIDSSELQTAMNARADRLLAEGGYEAETEGHDLQDVAANTLEYLDEADQTRSAFEELDDPDERLDFLLEIYLERADVGGEEFLLPWCVREIRRQAHIRGAEPVVARLTRELEGTRETRDSDEDASFTAVRLIRALQYFGSELPVEEQRFYRPDTVEQRDPISIDGLLPQPDIEWMQGDPDATAEPGDDPPEDEA